MTLERAAREDERHVPFERLAKLLLIIGDGVQFGMLCVGDGYVDSADTVDVAQMFIELAHTRAPRRS